LNFSLSDHCEGSGIKSNNILDLPLCLKDIDYLTLLLREILTMPNESIGTILTCLGGLLVILNLTIWNNKEYGLISAVGAVLIILIGLYFTSWKKKEDD